jgi:hypothetical protein
MIGAKLFRTAEMQMVMKFYENGVVDVRAVLDGKLATGKLSSSS